VLPQRVTLPVGVNPAGSRRPRLVEPLSHPRPTHASLPSRTTSGRHRAEKPPRVRRPEAARSVGAPVVAAAATLATVAGGLVSGGALTGSATLDTSAALGTALVDPTAAARAAVGKAVADRSTPLSRSDRRTAVDETKVRTLDQAPGGTVVRTASKPRPTPTPTPSPSPATTAAAPTAPVSSGDPRAVARSLLGSFGFAASEFSCLDPLWAGESGWDVHADNPSSSAYGIPQALPGSKMATAGPDWQNDAATQIKWGLGYIKGRYGTPCGAWSFKQAHGWY